MGTTMDIGFATNNNQPQNRDGDSVGDKLERGSVQTRPGMTQQQQQPWLAWRMGRMACGTACANDVSCTDGGQS